MANIQPPFKKKPSLGSFGTFSMLFPISILVIPEIFTLFSPYLVEGLPQNMTTRPGLN